ncbi:MULTISPECIES: YolD-like family protein [unclassified Sporosarcina]|uniref:YolD-like family protein n=1 Tax=unclassified Sporosarcina TaxID=2647733 RepID=UPI001A91650A|nr:MULTISPECIES: YolD-like family protein [unclassified Sporosarcina]MBO0588176.1 YolD-like family protein [Sporosarcina sp. E16_8]MBO0601930.1 YolD-like family protein [Sporosarcina sp. E16_3]
MTVIPKPKASKVTVVGPKLTETNYLENGERIGESKEFGVEVEITMFAQKRYESFTGVVIEIEDQRGILSLQVGYDNIKINMNNIVSVK